MADSRDITGKNRKFTGTGGIKLPTGTEAQRVNVQGQLRFNTDTNLAEYYDGTDWKPIDAPPTITGFTLDGGSSVTSTLIDNTAGGDATIVISGSNFDTTSGIVVFEPEAGGVNVTTQTIARTNSSSFTVTVTRTDFLEANDPYAIKLTNGSGLAATLASAIDVNVAPAFVNSADANLATVFNGGTLSGSTANASATDADGDTITYSIVSGSLPGSGLSISSSTGYIEGTLSGSPSSGEYLFTVRAATTNGNTDRQFKLTVGAFPTGGTLVSAGGNRYHIYTSSSTFVVNSSFTPNIEVFLVGAGGGGGSWVPAGGGAGGSVSISSPASISTSAQTYTVTVGAGGAGTINPGSYSWNSAPVTGGDTSLREAGGTYVLTAIGGGRGGSYSGESDSAFGNGQNGGCGGGRGNSGMSNGSGIQTSASTSPLGTPVSANSRTYGAGADGGSSSSNEGYGQYGGGGLSGSLRGNGDGQNGANYSWINPAGDYGTNTSNSLGAGNYFGGGGGAGNHSGGPIGSGGYGGGATGRSNSATKADSGLANTGGGGGGGGRPGGDYSEGGNGGSGICVIRYSG
jgi:hypothetical protein